MINKFINLIFLSFITLTTTQVNSQDNTFFRKYNLGGMQGGLQLAVTSDGGFIATGQHEGNGGNGDCDIYVYRVDLCGNIVWFKLYGTSSQEGGKSIKQTSDGGFVVSGHGPSNTSPRAFNMKLDPNGNLEWAKRYPSDWVFYSHEATNGDFISLAQNSLFRTDSVGNVLWRKSIGFMGNMNLWLDELSNGDIIVTSTGNGSDIYVGRFTSLGNTVWIKKYGAGYSSVDHVEWSSKGVVNSIENSVCVTSPTYLGSQGGENILVMKLNLTDGSLIWSKAVGGPASDQSRDIQLFPGGYAIAGNTASYPVAINPSAGIIQNFGERDALLFTMDENGNEIWSRTYGGDERDKAIGVQYNSDNGFTLSAYSSSSIFGNFDSSMDPLFIKTDSLGFVACQTNSPPLVFQDVSVSITPILTQPSDEGIDSYSFTANVIDFNPSDGYLCQQCISTPLFQVSDTAVCVGDTVSFFNTTIIGLTCFQQWYIDGQQYDGTINPFYSFDTAGDYQIQLMSTCGVNADTFNIVIHVYPIPTVDAGIDTIFCVNGILTLSAGGADTYIWSNGVINNVPFFPSSSGTFSVIGTTIYGCTNYDTLEIIINMRPEVLAQDTILCSDIACGVTLGDDIDGPTASTYNITAINSNGLSASAGTPLVANGVLNSNLLDDAWINTTNAPVDVIYTIVPISAAGCEGTPFTVTLTINPEPVVSNQVLTLCSDIASGLTLADDIDGPTASTYNISAINSNGLSSSAGLPLVANGVSNSNLIDDAWTNTTNTPVDVIYTLVPISAVACEGTPFTVTLTINPEPVVSNQVLTVCSDVACGLTLADDINGPTASSYNIITINSNGLSSSSGLPLVANGVLNSNLIDDAWTNTTNAPVDVIYTIVPISAAACEGTPFTVTLTINPEPLVPNQVGTVCSEDLIGVTLANDPNGPNLQSWNITNISIGSSLVPNSANVNVGTTISNQYIAGDIYVNNSILGIDVIYSLIPRAINACIGNPFTITITVNPLPVFNVYDAVVCADHYVTLTGNPSSYSYNWDHGVSNNVPFIPPYTDTYNVVATNTITGCIQYSSALVTVHPNPIADFIQSWDELMAIYTNTSTGAVNYYWNMGDGGIIITSKNVSYTYQIIDSVSYIVTLIAETEFGCLDTISRVITTPLVFYVPNSFTPDGNEYNNEFTPVFSSKRKVKNYSLSIYNRWGEIVFETKDIDFGWDGTYKNKAAQIGTYTWQLQFTNLFNSKKELINGHVNLLR
jgi:gliding motility-associated-like protein